MMQPIEPNSSAGLTIPPGQDHLQVYKTHVFFMLVRI